MTDPAYRGGKRRASTRGVEGGAAHAIRLNTSHCARIHPSIHPFYLPCPALRDGWGRQTKHISVALSGGEVDGGRAAARSTGRCSCFLANSSAEGGDENSNSSGHSTDSGSKAKYGFLGASDASLQTPTATGAV